MNWRTPVCQEIVGRKEFSLDQRDTAVLWVSELSALCDLWVSRAPAPHVERDPENGALMVSWLWQAKQRCFSLCVDTDLSVSLLMMDQAIAQTVEKPSHDVIKSAVRSFFEGWVPND